MVRHALDVPEMRPDVAQDTGGGGAVSGVRVPGDWRLNREAKPVESGVRANPTTDVLKRLAKALKVKVGRLLE